MAITTYSQFQALESSEKIGLVVLEASKRLMGWENHSGSIYKITGIDFSVISSLSQNGGDSRTLGNSIGGVNSFNYYLDRSTDTLYFEADSQDDPNDHFIACTFKLFFSNVPIRAPHDLSTGFEVEWLPHLESTADFGVELDNQNQLGAAIEGSGTVSFFNDQDYWRSKFDKLYFENQNCTIYSWTRELPITEAKLIYRGKVQTKEYTFEKITFGLKDALNGLRAPVPVSDMEDYVGALIPPALNKAKQRLLYGYVKGHRPTNIDQELPLSGYQLSGTVSITAATKSITGSSTSFLAQLTPGDEVYFGSDTTKYSIDTVTSNTAATITENYSGTSLAGATIKVKASHPKRYINREFLIAGHSIRQPIATVTAGLSLQIVQVDDATDFLPGDEVYLNSEILTVERVTGNQIAFTTTTTFLAEAGDEVQKIAVSNVYIDDRRLTYVRDYDYSAEDATLTLTSTAEFNVAPIRTLTGTLAFTSTSRTVTGTSTLLKNEVKPGDWIRRSGNDWFEVLSVDSDTQVTLRTAATYTSSGASEFRAPNVYDEGKTVLSCDTLGVTEDGEIDGVFIKTASQTVKDLLTRAGITDLDTDTFDEAEELSEHKIGLAIPAKWNETSAPTLRDTINKINQSVMGSLYQNSDFELSYSIISPARTTTLSAIREFDIVNMSIKSDSSRIAKTVNLEYLNKEFDPTSLKEGVSVASKTSLNAQYLAQSTNEFKISTLLVDSAEAQILANRWSFILEIASSIVSIESKMQLARVNVTQKLELIHEKLYERNGSSVARKVAGVSAARKTISGSRIDLDDLSNAFTRCGAITEDDASAFDDALSAERMNNGYITDNFGMQDNDPDTFGINLIW